MFAMMGGTWAKWQSFSQSAVGLGAGETGRNACGSPPHSLSPGRARVRGQPVGAQISYVWGWILVPPGSMWGSPLSLEASDS